ncbi:MAG TPA: BTAD domain-containing putative transcriptional regulator [Actinocrinis sp.]
MKFGILGQLHVHDDEGRFLPITGARQRTLLAALLLRANQIVSADELVEILWDGDPPPGGANTLRTYVMRLRRALGEPGAARVETREPGYLLRLEPDELDLGLFDAWYAQTEASMREDDAGSWQQAAGTAAAALALWRGTPLIDVSSRLLCDEWLPVLSLRRLQLAEWRLEADLRSGRTEALVPEIESLLARNPLREPLFRLHMLAPAGAGRAGEALAVYRQARTRLLEELGVEPGAELQRVHQDILVGEAARPRRAQGQLPVDTPAFTGRSAELDELLKLGAPSRLGSAAGMVVIGAINGMGGIGKTALAVRTAHRLADGFPDGQLFIDLHGYTKGVAPREAGQALESLLRALGVSAGQIPDDVEERAALYRHRLADTRTLILLDNAASEGQVRPLLPSAPGCLVLVTSRRKLKGLYDVHTVSLDLLPMPDACALLRAVAGPDRTAAGDPLLEEIAQSCGHLPLALRIAGALLHHRPAWSLEHLARLLRDQRRRVPALSDGERDLATVFDLSYAGLGEQHRVLIRRLGQVPGPDVDAWATAALLAVDPEIATGLLEDLVDHNLLISHAPGRYRMHDLVRAYADARAAADPTADRDAACDRLLHCYAHTAHSASALLVGNPRPGPPGPVPAHAPVVPDPETAWAWLRTERENLEAALTVAQTSALYEHFLAGDRRGEAAALNELGVLRRLSGDLSGATDALTRSQELYRDLDDRRGEALAMIELAYARGGEAGDLAAAADALAKTVGNSHAYGHRDDDAYILMRLGRVWRRTGDLPRAADALGRALEIHRASGNRETEAATLVELGIIRKITGDLPEAADAVSRALDVFRAAGSRIDEAWALNHLAVIVAATGDQPAARALYQQAVALNRELGKPLGEAYALEGLGECHLTAGETDTGADHLKTALALFQNLSMAGRCRTGAHPAGGPGID